MFFFLTIGCASFQAGASKKDFQNASFRRIYAEKIDSELLGIGDKQLRAQKIELSDKGIFFSIQSQDMCIKRDRYNELHFSQALGEPLLGSSWELGQAFGWVADFSVLGLSYLALQPIREEKEDLRPELLTAAAALSIIGINAYSLNQSNESRYQNKETEKETLVPCGNWRQEDQVVLTATNNGYPIQIEENNISLSSLSESWLTSQSETLVINWSIASTQYSGVESGTHTLTPNTEWLCHSLESNLLPKYLNSFSPNDVFLLTKEVSCPKALTQKICAAYNERVSQGTYSVGTQEFSSNTHPLSTQNIGIYMADCDVQQTWTDTFIRETKKLIDNGIGLFEISELIEQHDALLAVQGSAPMKVSFIEYAFSGIMERYDQNIRLYLYPTLSRYNDSEGVRRRKQQQNNGRIRARLEKDLRSCPDIWPAQSAPCLAIYIRFITNRNEVRDSYLKEQFISCSEKDMEIQQLCITPHKEHGTRYGIRWQNKIKEEWKRDVYQNARLMLQEDTPPAKRINQSLVYLQIWEAQLGNPWLQRFLQRYIRPEIESMVQAQIQDQSLASFEMGAKIVENYRNALGDRWANGARKDIDAKENRSLNSADRKANQEAKRLKNSRCSLWQYPKSASCTSRFSGFEECTPRPTINKRVYPECVPVKIEKCVCP